MVEHVEKGQRYPTVEEAVADYCRRLYVRDGSQREIVTSFVRERLVQTETWFCIPGTKDGPYLVDEGVPGNLITFCEVICAILTPHAIDYISLLDEQHARSLAQKERMGEGGGTFWSNQDVVDHFSGISFNARIENQIAGMQIPPGFGSRYRRPGTLRLLLPCGLQGYGCGAVGSYGCGDENTAGW